jgi:hypothetical protein
MTQESFKLIMRVVDLEISKGRKEEKREENLKRRRQNS